MRIPIKYLSLALAVVIVLVVGVDGGIADGAWNKPMFARNKIP